MTNYTRGRNKEYQLKRELEETGYVVYRMAGSHGDFDLIAFKPNEPVHLYQVKYTKSGTATKEELERFHTAPLPKGSTATLVVYKRGVAVPTTIQRKCSQRKNRRTLV